MKSITRVFQPDNTNCLEFKIKKLNPEKLKELTKEQKQELIVFFDDCLNDLELFKKELENQNHENHKS